MAKATRKQQASVRRRVLRANARAEEARIREYARLNPPTTIKIDAAIIRQMIANNPRRYRQWTRVE